MTLEPVSVKRNFNVTFDLAGIFKTDNKIKKHGVIFVEYLHSGDEVFYKRSDCHKWHGPGVMIG